MKTIISGSRTIQSYTVVEQAIRESGFIITHVFSGMRTGPDVFGYRWAMTQKIPVRTFQPDWAKLGKPADLIKCFEMAAYAEALISVNDGADHVADYQEKIARSCGLRIFTFRVERPKITLADQGRKDSNVT